MGCTETTGCSQNKKVSIYKSKQSAKALSSTNQRSILEMLWDNADGNSKNMNAESGDNNSLEALQEQNVEMRSESCEQETESESIHYQFLVHRTHFSSLRFVLGGLPKSYRMIQIGSKHQHCQ